MKRFIFMFSILFCLGLGTSFASGVDPGISTDNLTEKFQPAVDVSPQVVIVVDFEASVFDVIVAKENANFVMLTIDVPVMVSQNTNEQTNDTLNKQKHLAVNKPIRRTIPNRCGFPLLCYR